MQSQVLILYCDNISIGHLAKNPVLHSIAKHVEIDFHFVREKVKARELIVEYVPIEEKIVDIITKPLSSSQFENLGIKLKVLKKA